MLLLVMVFKRNSKIEILSGLSMKLEGKAHVLGEKDHRILDETSVKKSSRQ